MLWLPSLRHGGYDEPGDGHKIGENGQVSLPFTQQELTGFEEGSLVVATVHDGAVTLRPVKATLAELQARAGRYLNGPGKTTVDAFIAEGREEAAKEG